MTRLFCGACGEFVCEVSGSRPPVPVRHWSCRDYAPHPVRFGVDVTDEH